MKDLAAAKSRLTGILTPTQREALCLAMLRDVLRVLCAVPSVDEVRVVSSDRKVLAEAVVAGAFPYQDHAIDLNGALAEVAQALDPSDGMLIVPGDVPLVRVDEVCRVIAAGQDGGAIVGTEDGGTGALWVNSPAAIEFRFGRDSFRRHLAAARGAGVSMRVCSARGLAQDVDSPGDLDAVVRGVGTESATLVAAFLSRRRQRLPA
ncbi:MAG: 2-phospho-L-lactate guanylyltransferase [Burkholderiaceae bacterium]|nr:2-phospho-L-lactate guanylyltransferase [Burkholderiaceae bacterium]